MTVARRKQSSTNYANEAWLVRNCPFAYTLAQMGRRWRPALLWKLRAGPLHFAELARQLPRASEKMLTQEIQALVDAGLVERSAQPGRTVYALTARGHELAPVLAAMYDFGERHRGEAPEAALLVD